MVENAAPRFERRLRDVAAHLAAILDGLQQMAESTPGLTAIERDLRPYVEPLTSWALETIAVCLPVIRLALTTAQEQAAAQRLHLAREALQTNTEARAWLALQYAAAERSLAAVEQELVDAVT
jgi:hypothetical protein